MFVFVLAEVSMCKNPLLSAYLAASCTKTYTKCSQKSLELTGEKTCLGGDIPMTFGKVEFVPNQCNDDARIAFLLHLFDPPFGLSQRLLFTNHQRKIRTSLAFSIPWFSGRFAAEVKRGTKRGERRTHSKMNPWNLTGSTAVQYTTSYHRLSTVPWILCHKRAPR